MSRPFLVPIVLVGAAVVAAVLLLFLIGAPERPAADAKPVATAPTPPRETSASGSGFVSDDVFASDGRVGGSDLLKGEQNAVVGPAGSAEDAVDDVAIEEVPMQPWEEAINKILESDEENQQVAMRLMSLIPTLPPDGQVEAVQHMVNLTNDDSYQNAAAMLLNPATAEDVTEVIYSDVLNRPNNVKLPVMVSILRTPGHRLRDETLSTLQIFLGEDLGDNPEAWNAAVQNYLAKEAQEAAAAELEAQTGP